MISYLRICKTIGIPGAMDTCVNYQNPSGLPTAASLTTDVKNSTEL